MADRAACRRADGPGVRDLVPTPAGASAVQQIDPAGLIRVVLEGARNATKPGAPTGSAETAAAATGSRRAFAVPITRSIEA